MSGALRWCWKKFPVLAALITVPGILVALSSQRSAIETFSWRLHPFGLLFALLLLATAPLLQGCSFWAALRSAGSSARLHEVMLIWTRSFVLRYSPTGALAFVYRVRAKDRLAATRGQVLTATLYEQFLAMLAGVSLGVVCLLLYGEQPPLYASALLVTGVTAAFLARPGLLGERITELLAKRGLVLDPLLRGREQLSLAGINLIGWLSISAGNYILVRAISQPPPTTSFLYLSGAFAIAAAVGALIPTPGGVGTREAIMIVFLTAAYYDIGVATALTLALRLVGTAAELLAIGASELGYIVVSGLAVRRRFQIAAPTDRSEPEPDPGD